MTETFISLATLVAADGKREELRDALLALIDPTRREKGNLDYVLFEETDNPGTFVMREAFVNPAALGEHMRTPHFESFAKRAEDLLKEPLRLVRITQVSN